MKVDDDEDAYELFLSLYSTNRDRLLIYIQSMLPQRADAEDVFQRTSILLWQKFATYDRTRPFLPWAFGVAFYESKNFIRVTNRDRLYFNDEVIAQVAEERAEQISGIDDRQQALAQCVDSLPTKDQDLLAAAYGGGSLSDYAETQNRAVQTLYNRISRLRKRLLSCVNNRLSQSESSSNS